MDARGDEGLVAVRAELHEHGPVAIDVFERLRPRDRTRHAVPGVGSWARASAGPHRGAGQELGCERDGLVTIEVDVRQTSRQLTGQEAEVPGAGEDFVDLIG